jgi:peroxiredoxin Q/BCP
MALIEPGKRAPNFTLADQHGERHTLGKYRGRVVVLCFYPKDETPDCTIQACQFRDHHPDFSKVDAAVLGVSPDGADAHALFAENHDLDFPLLADRPRELGKAPEVSAAYGAWREKTLYGRKHMGIVRTTYLIDENGVVRRRWDRVKVTGHAAEVLATVKLLRGAGPRDMKPSKKRASEKRARRVTRARGEPPKAAAKLVKARAGRPSKVRGKAVPMGRRSRTGR